MGAEADRRIALVLVAATTGRLAPLVTRPLGRALGAWCPLRSGPGCGGGGRLALDLRRSLGTLGRIAAGGGPAGTRLLASLPLRSAPLGPRFRLGLRLALLGGRGTSLRLAAGTTATDPPAASGLAAIAAVRLALFLGRGRGFGP